MPTDKLFSKKRFAFPIVLLGVVSLCLLVVPDSFGSKDDDEIVLPGIGNNKRKPPPPRSDGSGSSGAAQWTGWSGGFKPIYGPVKEWQTFRSTAQITCAVRYGNILWAGTKASGLIYWNLKTGAYRFLAPRISDPLARKVRALAVNAMGDLWIGTDYGLAFVGNGRTRWKFYRIKNGLPSNSVRAIALTKKGQMWLGTPLGVAYGDGKDWKPGRRFTKLTRKSGIPGHDIHRITVDPQGKIWFGSSISKPFYRKGNKFYLLKKYPTIGPDCMVPDKKGGMWFCSDQGAVYYNPKKARRFRVYSTAHGLAGPGVQTIHLDKSGGIWFGTRRHGLSLYKGGMWKSMGPSDGLPGRNVQVILNGLGNQILAVTHFNGVGRYYKGRWGLLRMGIVGNRIQTIASAPDGSIWIGTKSGVSRYYRGYWYNYSSMLPNVDVRAFAFDPTGAVWAGTYGGGVSRFNGSSWRTYDILQGIRSNRIVGAGITPHGLWFAHPLKGISRYYKGRWSAYHHGNTKGVLHNSHIYQTMHIDRKFQIWLGSTGKGAVVFKRNRYWKRVRKMRGATTKGMIYGITTDKSGRVWFGTKHGLYRYHRGRLKRYHRMNGLPDNRVLAVAADGNKIWVGTRKGVACFDGTSWRRFSQDMGLASNHISSILVTPWGDKWFGSANDGVTVYRGQ